jgi:hypothetical protein
MAGITLATFALSWALPGPTRADLLTPSQAQLLQLWDTFENPESAATGLSSKVPSGPGVVYGGTLFDTPNNPFSPFVQMGIGANIFGSSSTGSGPTLGQVFGTTDLSAFAGFAVQFTNVEDHPVFVGLYMNTGFGAQNHFYQSGFVTLAPGQSAERVLDFQALGVVNLNEVTNLGLQVGADVTGTNPASFMVLASPVPEPSAWASSLVGVPLLTLGLWWRRRRGRA